MKRFVAAAAFFLVSVLLSSYCASEPMLPYTATIKEGRVAVGEIMKKTGASSLSLALIEGERIAWAETFGLADRASGKAPGPDTMYCIGSTSKMLATIAVMKLVDEKKVSLDAPLTDYIKSFAMLSPEYRKVTVRMLLNHSSGFPGTDYRNGFTSSPFPSSYSGQVLETLKGQRLKHPPGYLSVYCNDGFTLVEQLILAVTGRSYIGYITEEILTPLGMKHSVYPVDYLPEGAGARRYDKDGRELPQMFVNVYGSGGLYSTPTDMARVAMMLINRGKLGDVRILSEASVAAMGVDQTLTSFNPVKFETVSYGLGWDTVRQPGLRAVGVTAWQKGGSIPYTKTMMTIVPEEKLALIIVGASGGFKGDDTIVLAERILLAALAEKGRTGSVPKPLDLKRRPEKAVTEAFLDTLTGHYAGSDVFMRVERGRGRTLKIARYESGKSWQDWRKGLRMRDDGSFSDDSEPARSFSFVKADGRQYLVERALRGLGHYQDSEIIGQRVFPAGKMPAPWSRREGRKWLLTNGHPGSEEWSEPAVRLIAADGLLLYDWGSPQVVDPMLGDSRAGMMLVIPQLKGRDLSDVVIESRGGEEWLRLGSYLLCPEETVKKVPEGYSRIAVPEGLAQWRLVDASATPKSVQINPVSTNGRWRIYDSGFKQVETGKGAKRVTLSGGRYYLVFHNDVRLSH